MKRGASSSSSSLCSAKGAVVFLHGSGDTGKNFEYGLRGERMVRSLHEKGVRTAFPSARPIRYTLAGCVESVWFDRLGMEPSSPEQTETVERSVEQIEGLLDELVASGIKASKIAVGGFSMGGGLALQLGLRTKHDLAGVFSMSSYLCDEAKVFEKLEGSSSKGDQRPRFWMAHGADDDFVLPSWGQSTSRKLEELGLDVSWRSYPGLGHSLRSEDELVDLHSFLCTQLQLT